MACCPTKSYDFCMTDLCHRAFTIHSIVKYGGKALKDVKNQRLRTWGPIGLGLAAVPALPFMFDEPVEHAVEYIFHKGFEMAGHGQPAKEKEL